MRKKTLAKMVNNRCLYCYKELGAGQQDFHAFCSRKFFGNEIPPQLDYTLGDMEELAKEIVIKSVAVTGVQPKLSLHIEQQQNDPKRSRFTLVGLWGEYILKPPTREFMHLPENEDLTMHLAELAGIATAEHSLIRLKSGELAYITKRFDRRAGEKLPVEDMCQLTETLTEDKYKSSMEKVGKHLRKFSTVSGFDALRLFHLSVFCFLTGNADMHLKNFSLISNGEGDTFLSPAYDLLNTRLAMPEDKEEAALTINGKKARLKREDFDAFGKALQINEKGIQNLYHDLSETVKEMNEFIPSSFLPDAAASEYRQLLQERADGLNLL